MKTRLTFLWMVGITALFGWTTAQADTHRCQALLTAAPKNIDLEVSMQRPDTQVNSDFCLVSGRMAQRLGKDGRFYAINFEIRLPTRWYGRFAYQFNEGNDGEVKPALGGIMGLLPSQYAINQGFAVVSSDGGHDAKAYPEAGFAGSAAFAHDAEARRDYGYQAINKLYPVARLLIESYYQSPIQYSYGIGQSNGGRLAMVAATRFPSMFNGLLVGAPGLNAPKAALQHALDVQALHTISEDIRTALTERDLDFFARNVLNQCDALDGIHDDMIFAIDVCQSVFDPKLMVCKSDFSRDCLPMDKVSALIKMHKGPHNSKNQPLYASWDYDAGIRSKNWRMWKVASDIDEWDLQSTGAVLGAAALAHIYTTPFSNVAGNLPSLKKYLLSFDFDKDAPKIYATSRGFNESAVSLMTPPDAAKPKLTEFKQGGGKMMIFHGNSDPLFSVKDTVRWYEYLDFGLAGRAQEFVKLYRIPGMPHGQGGASVDQFNMLEPLIHWVEKHQSPQEVIAYTRKENPEITPRMVGLTRPLCPYPAYAQYHQGHYLKANSFACVIPQ